MQRLEFPKQLTQDEWEREGVPCLAKYLLDNLTENQLINFRNQFGPISLANDLEDNIKERWNKIKWELL